MAALELSENARRVLEARYLRRDEHRHVVETPEQLFRRVAHAIAEAEATCGGKSKVSVWEEEFYRLLTSLAFLPNSPALMNAGTGLGQLSACFVLPVPDTMEGIFDAVKQMALVQRTGGGTGFSFSRLRPRNDVVASTGGESSGPVSFMKIFDCATENIKQGGKRRGANMGVLRVDHPDILDFVRAKLDEKTLQNFNISVGATNAFMEAVRAKDRYSLVHPRTGQAAGSLDATDVFNAIADAAWRTGDPGLLFLDAINRTNPTPHLGTIEATNPCGEIPLLAHEACNLGSINLARMLRAQDDRPAIDWDKLRATARAAARFLDNIVQVNKYPVPEMEQLARGNRKIGLGVMGFAEMLVRLEISYDSDEAVALAERLMKFIADEALQVSRELAEERGVFPNWPGSVYERQGIKVRNATRTAIAPTGTIGIIAGTSPSIEPLFALAYRRSHVLEGQTLLEINPLFLEYAQRHGLDAAGLGRAIQEKGTLQAVPGVPEKVKRLFVTALEIPPERHLQIQAAFQRYVDNSVSKTINLPLEATPRDVATAYWRAWEMGLKGITIYRYGSKSTQVLELGVTEKAHHYDHASRCDPEECRV
jgi:ribonucleoside-diphosphate reductase alpha chain